MGPVMLRRFIALLALLTTAALLGDVAQIICFGEDGHVAVERLVSAEHLGAAPSSGATFAPVGGEPPERMHVDVSIGEAGAKNGLAAPIGPTMAVRLTAASVDRPTLPIDRVIDVVDQSLGAVRTTVLRI
jgi:hypothetical protein